MSMNQQMCLTLASIAALLAVLLGGGAWSLAIAQFSGSGPVVRLEGEPIHYDRDELTDPVAKLQQRLDAGELELEYDDTHGYLPALLQALDVPETSQSLVFSRTSLQQLKISPVRPRAIYFNDDVYVGWVQQGDVIEISSTDPGVGGVFYTLEQEPTPHPQFSRDNRCLQCHQTNRTQGVPGHLVRSVFADSRGIVNTAANQYVTDHSSWFEHRWGGWYVTGKHRSGRHMGNQTFDDLADPDPQIEMESGADIDELTGPFNRNLYLHGGHSDIVALMVLEHQTQMHNVITRAHYEVKMALHRNAMFNGDGELGESAERALDRAAEALLTYMLFIDEEVLPGPIEGSTNFAEQFEVGGILDSEGRSLRDFDLHRRLFAYPCSYLIYSEAFDALPEPLLDRVYRRLWEILTGRDESETFEPLGRRHRGPILQILRETKDDLPDYFHED